MEEDAKAISDKPAKERKSSVIMGLICGALAVCLISVIIMAATLIFNNEDNIAEDDTTEQSGTMVETDTVVQQPSDTEESDTVEQQPTDTEESDTVEQQPSDTEESDTVEQQPTDTEESDTTTEEPTETEEPFEMSEFVNSVANIANEITEEDVSANIDILCENIGENKLKELINKYGELSVKKGVAELLVFVPEVKMDHYINKNGLNFNPNAVIDFSQELQKLNDAYTEATGKNPDGALMSLPGYDAFNGNRDALRAMIVESGDTALLTWYNAKMEIYDTMRTQTSDTEKALTYKEAVETEILTSAGTIKLLELQLEKEASGELTAMDNITIQYTEAYYNFILNNYVYVVAN